MDNKQITNNHQKIIKKNIEESLKYRENRLKELENDKNRIQNYQKKVKVYNENKFKEYNEILESLKNTSKNYYQYYKQYEKKHGWKKTTQLLEKRNLMKQWVNFIPIFKYIKPSTLEETLPIERIPPDRISYPSKPSSPPRLPPHQIPKSLPPPESYYDDFNPEEQYINEEKMLENLTRDSARNYLYKRMLRAGFDINDIARALEILSDSQIYQIVDEIQRLIPLDDENDPEISSPPRGQYTDEYTQEVLYKEYIQIMNILDEYEVFL